MIPYHGTGAGSTTACSGEHFYTNCMYTTCCYLIYFDRGGVILLASYVLFVRQLASYVPIVSLFTNRIFLIIN